MTEGRLSLEVAGDTLKLGRNSLALISPFMYYSGTSETVNDSSGCHDELEFHMVEFGCSNFTFFPLDKYALFPDADAARGIMAELADKYTRGEQGSYIYDAILLELIYIAEKLTKVATPQEQLAERIRDHILKNLMKPTTVDDLSDLFMYNKDYLSRVFKAKYGTTVKDYINTCKLDQAKKLLVTSDISVASVARFLGWEDVNLFIKFFKYHEGQSPLQYRKNSAL